MNIDWPSVFDSASSAQLKVIQDVKTLNLYSVSPAICNFTGEQIVDSGLVFLANKGRDTIMLLASKEFFVKNYLRIKSYLEIAQGYFNEPMVLNVVDSVPQFKNYRPWINTPIRFVSGSLKDLNVDTSRTNINDRTRFAGRDKVDPEFLDNMLIATQDRIKQLDDKTSVNEALTLLDDIQNAKPVHAQQKLLGNE